MAAFTTDLIRLIEQVFGKGQTDRGARNLYVRCPICAPKDRTKLKLVVLLADQRTHCWVCGYKARSLWALIRKHGTREQLDDYVARFMPEGSRPKVLSLHEEVAEELRLPDGFRLLAASSTRDPDVAACLRYLQQRGVTERDMWYFKLGTSDEWRWRRRVIVPSFDAHGRLNYFTARAIDPTRRPKYDNPWCDRLPIVFNELNVDWMRPLALCEGPFDLMKCPDNAVPLLGSELTERYALFTLIAEHRTPVVLVLDADVRRTKVPRIAKRLAALDVPVTVAEVDPDPGSSDRSTVMRAIERARPLSWLETFSDRLERASKLRL